MSNTMDFSGVSATIDGAALATAITPHVIKAVLADQNLQNQLIAAVLPALRAQMATLAKATGTSGTTTPRIGTGR